MVSVSGCFECVGVFFEAFEVVFQLLPAFEFGEPGAIEADCLVVILQVVEAVLGRDSELLLGGGPEAFADAVDGDQLVNLLAVEFVVLGRRHEAGFVAVLIREFCEEGLGGIDPLHGSGVEAGQAGEANGRSVRVVGCPGQVPFLGVWLVGVPGHFPDLGDEVEDELAYFHEGSCWDYWRSRVSKRRWRNCAVFPFRVWSRGVELSAAMAMSSAVSGLRPSRRAAAWWLREKWVVLPAGVSSGFLRPLALARAQMG